MRFCKTEIPDVFVVEATPHEDARGAFARLYCPNEFAEAGIAFAPQQVNLSTNVRKHTLRGMHFQPAPYAEAKLVRAVAGRAFDVVVDLRPESPTCGRWIGVELCAKAMNAVFVPQGCAHGFLTLEDDTALLYQMGRIYAPGHGAGYRWDDPAFGIEWPAAPVVISEQDCQWPPYSSRST
ncbi:dTDP-4-dehydrorhamnose 3,5-epimerase [Breoghania sp.]|uniref:dTDP-4-dehydrorhamnose 3,5-epimerase n=1 Tax=Breoghania sp. TaxID=2065378 RepID=UPI0029C9D53A|nr:dTDP-4-dehydrorhamnose 3,5-epimerase [Breoghania sp.]